MAKFKIEIDGKEFTVDEGKTILDAARENGIEIPTMCYFEGLSKVGACRLCNVEVEGSPKLFPACTTPVAEGQKITVNTEKLKGYRRMIVELFFSERNHVCAVCAANGACELQELGYQVGMTHVRFPYLYQKCEVDGTHPYFMMDHNRCVMCTRCVRVCDEVEGARHWDVKGRGYQVRTISDFDTGWGESETCTSCGKCMEVCPTGAIWSKGASIGRFKKKPDFIRELIEKKKAYQA